MKQKNSFLLVLLVCVLFLSVFLAGCNLFKSVSSNNDDSSDFDLEELFNMEQKEEPEPTSSDIITKEFEEKKLTKTQAMSLEIIANYNPEELPKKYQSEETNPRSNFQEAEHWLQENYDSLDEETQKLLRPYYVLPNDPDSYLNKESSAVDLVEFISIIPSVEGAPAVVWESLVVITPTTEATIFYKAGDAQAAETVKEAFIKSSNIYEPFFDAAIPKSEIFIIPMSSYGSIYTTTVNGEKYNVIKIRKGLSEKMIKPTVAHEVFHAFQFAIGVSFTGEGRWLMEATAVWAEDFVYPEINSEHEYLDKFYTNLGKDMVFFGSNREYSTYTWPFFLEQYYNDPSIIRQMLDDYVSSGDARSAATIDIVEDDFAFSKLFAEYAFWNFNAFNMFREYQDSITFPGSAFASSNLVHKVFTDDKENEIFPIETEALSTQYLSFIFKDGEKIEFDFFEEAGEEVRRLALLKYGPGDWRKEDWTKLKEKKFCRNNPDEDILAAIIIISNADISEAYDTESVEVNIEPTCEPTWHGSTALSWNKKESEVTQTPGGIAVTRTMTVKGEYTLKDTLKMVEPEDDFVMVNLDVITSNINYYSYIKLETNYGRSCGLVRKVSERTERGTLFLDQSEEEYPYTRIFYNLDYPDKGIYLDVDVSDETDWITVDQVNEYKYNACPGEGEGEKSRDSSRESFESEVRMYPIEEIIFDFPVDDQISGSHEHVVFGERFGDQLIDYEVQVLYDYVYE